MALAAALDCTHRAAVMGMAVEECEAAVRAWKAPRVKRRRRIQCDICGRAIEPWEGLYHGILCPDDPYEGVACEQCADPHGDSVPADIKAMRGWTGPGPEITRY